MKEKEEEKVTPKTEGGGGGKKSFSELINDVKETESFNFLFAYDVQCC